MDPSIFFGRSRLTRQTTKPKQPSTDKENLKSEVKTVKQRTKADQKSSKRTLAEVKNEAIPTRRNAARGLPKCSEKAVIIANDIDVSAKEKILTSRTGKKVCFSEETILEDDAKKTSNSVASGPVYKNVRRSDVRDDPVDEYAFDEDDSSSESTAPPKKKKKRQPQKKNPPKNIVKWDPSKKPVLRPTKPSTKSQKSKPKATITTASSPSKTTVKSIVLGNKATLNSQPTGTVKVAASNSDSNCSSLKKHLLSSKMKEPLLIDNPADSSMDFQIEHQFTSTPTEGKLSTKLNLEKEKSIKSSVEVRALNTVDTPTFRKNLVSILKEKMSKPSSVKLSGESGNMSPASSSPFVSCSTTNQSSTSKQTLNKKCDDQTVATRLVESNVKHLQRSTAPSTPVRTPPCISVPTICVRESPSFMEPEPTLQVPFEDSSIPSSPLQPVVLRTVSSTPVTRSRSAVNFNASSSTTHLDKSSPRKKASSSPHAVAEEPSFNSADLSNLFDDLPRTSVIPTRMFSTHRGTVFIPEGDNVIKRTLPELSPCKEQVSSRATTVKFSVPQSSSGLDDCFGFDNDDSIFIPKSDSILARKRVNEQQKPKKPNLSVQEVQALLRGQLQFASPASGTPRSVQTKLTDFVSSTPTTSIRSKPNQVILTPTPVPLFGEENLDTDIQSPFNQPSRRSYDRFRPPKRIACGDEVLSDDEADEKDANQNASESTGVELKKKSRSYRKKKKPEETQLENWARQMELHFKEVENVDLEVK
ncbi:Sororin [Frankliniella fusca]|uniref:Sororin n=1 Tax=Frankliniella fusca TaxID=407009 RepID=A0AAE1HYV5_9NEOP|nr:Sororin [Frankliniella fusca]